MSKPLHCDRVRMSVTAQKRGRFRESCAGFWLNVMFALSRHAPWAIRLLRPLGTWGAWTFSHHFREETALNARHILGPVSTTHDRHRYGRSVVESFYDFIFDIGRTSAMSRDELRRQIVRVEGEQAYREFRKENKGGVIIATAHMGSFELGMTALLEVEREIHVVFQRDANLLFERLRSDFRKRMGIREAAVDEGFGIWMHLREALASDAVVAMQADRAMPGQMGVKVPFLDGHALFPEGPAKLAAITGAPIIPVFAIRQPDGRVAIHIERPIRVAEPSEVAIAAAIAKLAEVVGEYVRRHPDQWLVVNRAWCEDVENA